jgi:hypothetical protein
MATSGQVTLRGRFRPGSVVRLVRVANEGVRRSEGGDAVDTKRVGEDGSVTFRSGVESGARYLIVGYVDGFPLEVRAVGRSEAEDTGLAQQPVGPDRVRLSDGSWADEAPEHEGAPGGEVGPAPGLHQVSKGTRLRSATPRGYAHPVEDDEPAPYPAQSDVEDGVAQRSDTEFGMATPVAHEAPSSQSDVGARTAQRSATPMGYAYPVPAGDGVRAQRDRESAETKASVGEPVKAASSPPSRSVKAKDRDRDRAVVGPPPAVTPDPGVESDGRDAQGQPLAGDVAAGVGVEPASSPREPVRRRSGESSSSS